MSGAGVFRHPVYRSNARALACLRFVLEEGEAHGYRVHLVGFATLLSRKPGAREEYLQQATNRPGAGARSLPGFDITEVPAWVDCSASSVTRHSFSTMPKDHTCLPWVQTRIGCAVQFKPDSVFRENTGSIALPIG
jgi:hypothetical protein